MIINERTISDLHVIFDWNFDEDTGVIRVTDSVGTWTLHPRDRAEATEMYNHPYVYSENADLIPVEIVP